MAARGFSFVELIILLAVMGILAGVVGFSLNRRGLELNRAANDALSLVQAARFEAIKRNRVAVLGINNGTFRVFVDQNNNGSLDSGEFERSIRLADYGSSLGLDLSFDGASAFRWSPEGLPWQTGSTTLTSGFIGLSSSAGTQRICVNGAGLVKKVEGSQC